MHIDFLKRSQDVTIKRLCYHVCSLTSRCFIEWPCKNLPLTWSTLLQNSETHKHKNIEVYGVHDIWYQSESLNARAYWAQDVSAYFILTNYWIFLCDNRNSTSSPCSAKLDVPKANCFWPCNCAGERGTSSHDHKKIWPLPFPVPR